MDADNGTQISEISKIDEIDYRRALSSVLQDKGLLRKASVAALIVSIATVSLQAGGWFGTLSYFLTLIPLVGFLAQLVRAEARATNDEMLPCSLPNWNNWRELISLGFQVSILAGAFQLFDVTSRLATNATIIALMTSAMDAQESRQPQQADAYYAALIVVMVVLILGAFAFNAFKQMTLVRCADRGFLEGINIGDVANIITRAGMRATLLVSIVDLLAYFGMTKAYALVTSAQQAVELGLAGHLAVIASSGAIFGVVILLLLSISYNLWAQLYRRALRRPNITT